MKLVVTGGAGFIGSALCRHLIRDTSHSVVNVDKLTYAANLTSLDSIAANPRYTFYPLDICDRSSMDRLFEHERPDGILHLAAESHVDRSIAGPAAFVTTNVVGTYTLLEAARVYWETLAAAQRDRFRFLHVSTDEVFGSLGPTGTFSETTPYDPSSPYSATKAASDHLVIAWHRTYGVPILRTNCSNNYGPYHFPEKLIPLVITNALLGKPLPVYGTGNNVRDWIYVEDHANALRTIFEMGQPGTTYNVGGRNEHRNIDVVHQICSTLDRLSPRSDGKPHSDAIQFVTDRPGHDFRYAIDPTKLETEIGWRPAETFASGLEKTVQWFLANEAWWKPLRQDRYHGERLGLLSRATPDDERQLSH